MRSTFFALFLLTQVSLPALAGSNAGGTLVLHALDLAYTTDGSVYCNQAPPRECEAINPTSSGAPLQVYTVLAVFSAGNKPRLRGVEFGVSYSGVLIDDWGSCAEVEDPMSGWPASGTGTVVVWSQAQTERIVPIYWFAGYLASLTDAPSLELTPHPQNGGHFGDDHVPTHLDGIAGYGTMGFGQAGTAPCPAARVFTVRPDGTGDVPTIQDAIYLAAPGSVIELENGVYRGPGNRDIQLNDTHLTIRSKSGIPDSCVIDCEGSPSAGHRAFWLAQGESSRPSIEGIKITGGYIPDDAQSFVAGGAIHGYEGCAFVVRNCIFEDCSAKGGAGAIQGGGNFLAEDCVFRSNVARERGGGAIMWPDGSIVLRRCRFEGNHAATNGGALQAIGVPVQIEDCVFVDNSANRAGAVYVDGCSTNITGCTILANQAVTGGALYCGAGETNVTSCTLSDNRAPTVSGIYADDAAGDLGLQNSIVSFGLTGIAIRCGGKVVTARACDVYGNQGGDWPSCLAGQSQTHDNFSADPLYCDRGNHDLHLDAASPCAEEFNPIRGQVGAMPVGCGVVSVIGAPPMSTSTASITGVTPNPFTGSTRILFRLGSTPASRPAIQVFDAAGRSVRKLIPSVQSGLVGFVDWEGRNEAGDPVPAGVYFVRLDDGASESRARVVLIR